MASPIGMLLTEMMKNRVVQETLAQTVLGASGADVSGAFDAMQAQQQDLVIKSLLSSPAANAIDAAGTFLKDRIATIKGKPDFAPQPGGASGSFDLNATLLALSSSPATEGTPAPAYTTFSDAASIPSAYTQASVKEAPANVSVSAQPVGTGKSTLFTNLQDVADEAAAAGQKVVMLSGGKKVFIPDPAIPSNQQTGFDSKANMTGLAELTDALNKATDDQEKLRIAFQIKQAANSQLAFNYGKYSAQAEAELGVPDLTAAIANVKKAESVDPSNPRNGLPSNQRLELQAQLGVAQARVKERIGALLQSDPAVINASHLADSTIEFLKVSTSIAGKDLVQEQRQAGLDAKEAGIESLVGNQQLIGRVAAVTQGNFIPSDKTQKTLAGQIYDKKIGLKGDTAQLIEAPVASLQAYLIANPQENKQAPVIAMLKSDEVRALNGNTKQADINIKLMTEALKLDLDSANIPQIYKDQWAKAKAAQMANVGESKQAKDAALNVTAVNIKMGILNSRIEKLFTDQPTAWQGVISSDPTAQAVMKVAKGPMDANAFISSYLNYNDGKKMTDKIGMLRQIISSAAQAWPKSAILPDPSPESLLLRADRISVQSLLPWNAFGRPKPSGWEGSGAQDFFRSL